MKNNTLKMVVAALLVALAFVFALFTIRISEAMQIGFTEFPLLAAGFILGPFYGALTGLVKDLLEMMRMGYPPSLYTLAPVVLGLLPGIALKVFGSKKLYNSIPILFLVILITTLTRTFVVSLSLHYVNGLEWGAVFVTLPPKIIIVIIEAVIYTVAFKMLLPLVKNMFNKIIAD